MVYRTGTYIAFDGLGETNPAKSDYRYYTTIQGWNRSNSIEFKFVNSHDKASSVRDTSKRETLYASIRQRLRSSKNMLVVVSRDTRKSGSVLSWEIEKGTDDYCLPLIIAYAGYYSILAPEKLSDFWPNTLAERISRDSVSAIHVPFKKDAIFDAISRFTVNGEEIGGSLVTYTEAAHKNWGYI